MRSFPTQHCSLGCTMPSIKCGRLLQRDAGNNANSGASSRDRGLVGASADSSSSSSNTAAVQAAVAAAAACLTTSGYRRSAVDSQQVEK